MKTPKTNELFTHLRCLVWLIFKSDNWPIGFDFFVFVRDSVDELGDSWLGLLEGSGCRELSFNERSVDCVRDRGGEVPEHCINNCLTLCLNFKYQSTVKPPYNELA